MQNPIVNLKLRVSILQNYNPKCLCLKLSINMQLTLFEWFAEGIIKNTRKVVLILQLTFTSMHLADQEQVSSLRVSLEEFTHVSPLRIIDYRLRRWHCKQKNRHVNDMRIFQFGSSGGRGPKKFLKKITSFRKLSSLILIKLTCVIR